MAAETRTGGGILLGTALSLPLAIPVLYALSIGPAVFLVDRTGWGGGPVMRTFYKPVTCLRTNRSLQEPYDSYVDWWLQR